MSEQPSFADLKARTAAALKGGTAGTYPAHAAKKRRAKKAGATPAKCPHEGRVLVPCHSCGGDLRHVRDCEIHGTCTRVECGKDVDMVCARCDDHPARKTARSLPVIAPPAAVPATVARAPRFSPKPDDVAVGVAIGSYGWPALVELQVRVVRDTCGPVPILISSDKPESNAELAAICAAHPDVTLWPNPERIGHTGGDVAVYHKAVTWGASRNLAVVAKLSQRFIATRPRWLHDGAIELLASGLPLATRRCRGKESFPLRTEAALLDVRRWHRPEVLARVAPRRYWHDLPTGRNAEMVVADVLRDELGGVYWPWSLISEDRYARAAGALWHCSHSPAEYFRLAQEYGVTLPADFHTDGWQRDFARGEYLHG